MCVYIHELAPNRAIRPLLAISPRLVCMLLIMLLVFCVGVCVCLSTDEKHLGAVARGQQQRVFKRKIADRYYCC